MTYFAIIGDLVESRNLADRAEVQERFQTVIAELNEDCRDSLEVPLKITAGDEVQGLSRHPRVFVDIMVRTSDALRPVGLSWGWGFGELATDLVEDVALLDGPCLHLAREAVENAKEDSRWLRIRGFPEPAAQVLDTVVNVIRFFRSTWTDRQAEIVKEARGKLQTEVADRLGVAQSTVSRTLAAAHYTTVLELEEAAQALLRALEGEAVS